MITYRYVARKTKMVHVVKKYVTDELLCNLFNGKITSKHNWDNELK